MAYWIASFMVGWLALGVGYVAILIGRHLEKGRRPPNGSDPLYMQRVSVATDLTPLIRGLAASVPFKGSELWIFGCDGRYVVKNKRKRWRKELSAWAAQGLYIKYILLDADQEVCDEIAKLQDKMQGKLDAVRLLEGSLPDLASELETCHPTLFIGPDNGNAAWIERLHPRDSTFAYDVKYVSPNAMLDRRERAEFEAYKRKLELVINHSVPITSPKEDT